MKKSILIFLFISSTLSAFYYALSRTEGNVYKSIIFTMYFLSIKLNLVEPNLPIILDQCQSDEEIVRVLPYYTSNYSDSYYGRSRIYMAKIEQPNYVSYHSQSVIDELRAGGRLKDAAFFLAMLYMLKYHTVGFQPVGPVVRPPHIESAHNLLFGKPKVDKFSSQRFNTELEGRRRQRAESFIDMNEEYQKFLLTKNPNVKCSQKRFEELCVEKKNGRANYDSIDEALSILEAEGQGIVINPTRPEPNAVDADFEIQGPGVYDVVDVKIPINWGKGNANLKVAAERMGGKIVKQRSRMQGLGKIPLHLVDLRKLSPNERVGYKENVINTIGHSKHIVFLNEETKNS